MTNLGGFKSDGYYSDELEVQIEVDLQTGEVRLYNSLYIFLTGCLPVKNGVVHFANKDYLLQNFIPERNNLAILQQNEKHDS